MQLAIADHRLFEGERGAVDELETSYPLRRTGKANMERYEIDEFSDAGFSDDSINVNRVLSWRHEGAGLIVDYQGGWFVDTRDMQTECLLQERLLNALRSVAQLRPFAVYSGRHRPTEKVPTPTDARILFPRATAN